MPSRWISLSRFLTTFYRVLLIQLWKSKRYHERNYRDRNRSDVVNDRTLKQIGKITLILQENKQENQPSGYVA